MIIQLSYLKLPEATVSNTQYAELSQGAVRTIPYQVCLGVHLQHVLLTVFLRGRVLAARQEVHYWILSTKTAFIIRVSYCVSLEEQPGLYLTFFFHTIRLSYDLLSSQLPHESPWHTENNKLVHHTSSTKLQYTLPIMKAKWSKSGKERNEMKK